MKNLSLKREKHVKVHSSDLHVLFLTGNTHEKGLHMDTAHKHGTSTHVETPETSQNPKQNQNQPYIQHRKKISEHMKFNMEQLFPK